MGRHVDTHMKIMKHPTAVVFDEIHHLSEKANWGSKASKSFELARFSIGLSGTPFRGDRHRISFVKYEQHPSNPKRLDCVPDFAYPLEMAVAAGYCREFQAKVCRGLVKVPNKPGSEEPFRYLSFDDDSLSKQDQRRRLRGAVHHGSTCRLNMLKEALTFCRESNPPRKAIIFLGGMKSSTKDASEHLPGELASLGITSDQFISVVGKGMGGNLQPLLDAWCISPTQWILIADGRLTEGANLPAASVAIFLSCHGTALKIIQRIGRIIRKPKDDPWTFAYAWIFRDRRYVHTCRTIEKLIQHEIHERDKLNNGKPPGPGVRVDGIGVAGGNSEQTIYKGHVFSKEILQQYEHIENSVGLFGPDQKYALLRLLTETSDRKQKGGP